LKLQIEEDKIRPTMLCKICHSEETDNPDGRWDECKFNIINDKEIPPNI